MKISCSLRIALATATAFAAAAVPAAAFPIVVPIADAENLKETVKEYGEVFARWSDTLIHYQEQIDGIGDELDKADALYNQLNSIKFKDLLKGDLTGSAARNSLHSLYDGTNETFGLGLPNIPTEGQLLYYGNKGFTPSDEMYSDNKAARISLETSERGLWAIEAAQAQTRALIEAKDERLANLDEEYDKAVDMKAALELNHAMLREQTDIMIAYLALQNARASDDVARLTASRSKRSRPSQLFGNFNTYGE